MNELQRLSNLGPEMLVQACAIWAEKIGVARFMKLAREGIVLLSDPNFRNDRSSSIISRGLLSHIDKAIAKSMMIKSIAKNPQMVRDLANRLENDEVV